MRVTPTATPTLAQETGCACVWVKCFSGKLPPSSGRRGPWLLTLEPSGRRRWRGPREPWGGSLHSGLGRAEEFWGQRIPGDLWWQPGLVEARRRRAQMWGFRVLRWEVGIWGCDRKDCFLTASECLRSAAHFQAGKLVRSTLTVSVLPGLDSFPQAGPGAGFSFVTSWLQKNLRTTVWNLVEENGFLPLPPTPTAHLKSSSKERFVIFSGCLSGIFPGLL